jgi:hypothetical protein
VSGLKGSWGELRMKFSCNNFQVLNQGQTKFLKKEIIFQSVIVPIIIAWLIQIAEEIKKPQYLTKSVISHHVNETDCEEMFSQMDQ